MVRRLLALMQARDDGGLDQNCRDVHGLILDTFCR